MTVRWIIKLKMDVEKDCLGQEEPSDKMDDNREKILQCFPFSSDLGPQRLPADHYDVITDLKLIDLYERDLRVADEETWLSGDFVIPRRSFGSQKSSSLDSLSASTLREISKLPEFPVHSTPTGGSAFLNGHGDCDRNPPHSDLANAFLSVSPIDERVDGSKGCDGTGAKNELTGDKGGSTFNKGGSTEGNQTYPKENGSVLNDSAASRDSDSKSTNRTFEKESKGSLPLKSNGVFARPVGKPALPAPKAGLRAPGPPVTMRATRPVTMNRTASLGNISGVDKKLSVSNGPAPSNGNSAKMPQLRPPTSKIPRPATKLPAPASSIPSRIPRPGAKTSKP